MEKLIAAAKKENWGFVDKQIPYFANDPNAIKWAKDKGLVDEDSNVRDLAASLLEKTSNLDERTETKLYGLMSRYKSYAGFRAACALASHDWQEKASEVRAVLKKAAKDANVGNIAKRYLQSYGKKNA